MRVVVDLWKSCSSDLLDMHTGFHSHPSLEEEKKK